MLNGTNSRLESVTKCGLNLFLLTAFLFSQMSLSEIFLYQTGGEDLVAADVAAAAEADGWYSADWSYRQEITIDHAQVAGGTLTDFPFLFSVTDADLEAVTAGGKVGQEDGGDILFTLGDGTTKLAHEMESYDGATGRVNAWVKVPAISDGADTKLYVYYGNALAADQQDKNHVWDGNYRMVQHLGGAPANAAAGGHLDSTANAMDGTPDRFSSPATTGAEGKIGGADLFKDSVYARTWYNDVHNYSRVTLPSSVLGDEESFTLSSWMKSNAAGAVLSNNGGEADYCAAAGYAYEAYYLRNVTFNTINKSSSSTYDGIAYNDYTNLSTTVQAGQTYTIYTTNAPYMHHYIKAWIDYNQDGDFADAGEETVITTESSYQVGHSASITIPTTALNGPTRMRVRAIDNYYVPSACGYQYYTETEDYTVNVQGSAYNKAGNAFTFGSFDTGKFSVIKDGVTYDVAGDSNLNDSSWHYLSATYDAAGMKLYVDGVLKGTNGSISGSLSPLRSGFWIGRYLDDRNGRYGFDGTIDEVRISTSSRDAAWIQTEYNNQNSPGTFFSREEEESRVMDRFALAGSVAEITSGESLTLTIRALNNRGEIFVPYDGEKTLLFSGAAAGEGGTPTATDKDGRSVVFGENTVLDFVDGVASTTLTLHAAEIASIAASDGEFAATPTLAVEVNSKGGAFLPPSKPAVTGVRITYDQDGGIDFENLPDNITQIAVALTDGFADASWEEIQDRAAVLQRFAAADQLYVKFRTVAGGVSEIMVVERKKLADNGESAAAIGDGDIVKSPDSPDVYIIKLKNGKRYKRLILSPQVFGSYGHLRWENLKVWSATELESFVTSELVRETSDPVIYRLRADGDRGERTAWDPAESYDADAVYEINSADRDSYALRP